MTPKERAIELRELFFDKCNVTIAGTYTIFRELSKAIAIAAVDEMLNDKEDALDVMFDERDIALVLTSMDYLQQVKQEIQNL